MKLLKVGINHYINADHIVSVRVKHTPDKHLEIKTTDNVITYLTGWTLQQLVDTLWPEGYRTVEETKNG
jgi:hypothetical protein